MKTKISFITALLYNLLACIVFSPVLAYANDITEFQAFTTLAEVDLGINLTFGAVYLAVYYFTGKEFKLPQGSLNEITRQIWVDYIIENLFKDNSFINRSFDEGGNVLNGTVVHIPQAGVKRQVTKNRVMLPASIIQRSDTDITYALDEYTTQPVLITNAEMVELSYDKIANVLSEDMDTLREIISNWMLYNWRPETAANIIRTSGGNVDPIGDQTGQRKLFTKEDLKKARYLMNKQNISKENRIAILCSEHLDQLQADADLLKRDYARELDMKNGVIERLFGFEIMERSDVLTYNNAGTPVAKLPDALPAATDNFASLIYQQNQVARAMGEVNAFDDQGNPLYYGDIYSFLCRMGGRKRRANGAGVIAIVQSAV